MKFLFPATLLLIAATVAAQQSPIQSPNDDVENYSLEATSFIDALLKISAQFQFPMGVEWVKSADTLKPVRFSRPRTTMKEIIQAVVSTPAGYDWRMEDGVVHVFQHKLMEDSRNPLNITIESFNETPQKVGWANMILFQMVDHVVRHPERSGFGGSLLVDPTEPDFRFTAKNVPARTVLNEIVRAGLSTDGRRMQRNWIATFPEAPAFSRTGFLEVVSEVGSDQDQPFWNLLSWGAAPLANIVK